MGAVEKMLSWGKVCRCWKFPSSFFVAGGKYVYCSCDGKAIDVHLLLHCEEASQGQRVRSILMIIICSNSPLYLLIWVKLPWQSPFNYSEDLYG